MITWPIFVALFLSIIAVYFSIKMDERNINEKKQQPVDKEEFKRKDLIKRKERIENDKKARNAKSL